MILSVIVPVYNEKNTIFKLLETVKAAQIPAGIKKEIIVVNDGSTDGTKETLDQIKPTPEIKIFHSPQNQGKTHAVVFGLKQARGDIMIIQDADLEYSPEHYAHLIKPILNKESQIVYGSRFMGTISRMTPINRMANRISNLTINALFGTKMTDFHTCYKMFTREAIKNIDIISRNFSFDTEITAKFLKNGFTILEIPIEYAARSDKEGKKMNWPMALETYGILFKVRFEKSRKM
jgi:glycosyltransferase involved in cell wall biosynthesis